MQKVVATIAILIGGVQTVLQLAVAFGLHITPDQHTAIGAVAGLVTTAIGIWIHPSLPGGPKVVDPPLPGE